MLIGYVCCDCPAFKFWSTWSAPLCHALPFGKPFFYETLLMPPLNSNYDSTPPLLEFPSSIETMTKAALAAPPSLFERRELDFSWACLRQSVTGWHYACFPPLFYLMEPAKSFQHYCKGFTTSSAADEICFYLRSCTSSDKLTARRITRTLPTPPFVYPIQECLLSPRPLPTTEAAAFHFAQITQT